MSRADRLRLGPPNPLGWLVAGAGILFVLPLSDFWTFVFIGGLSTAMIALSVGVVYGRTGMVSLCQFSFAAVGVWTMAWLNVHTDLPFAILLLAAGAAAVPAGLMIGLLSLRLRGINLAVATLGFASASFAVLRRNAFPGVFSNQPIRRPAGFESETSYFLFCCLVFALVVAILSVISATRTGRGWLAVRQSERAAAALGLSVPRVKLVSFSVGAFIAGLGGGLLAGQNGLVSNRSFEPFDSLLIFAVSVLAGARYIDGAIAAGLLGAVLPELFRKWGIPLDVAPMLFGVGAIAVLSQGAEGAQGQLRTLWRAREASRAPDPAPDRPPCTKVEDGSQFGDAIAEPLPGDGVLELMDVSVSYGAVLALDQVSLRITPDQVHGLVGPNGAGKSTLIDAVTGFVRPTGGQIHLGSVDLMRQPVHRRSQMSVRRTFQQERTIEEMLVGDYLEFAAGRRLDDDNVADVLDFFDCPAADRRIASIDVATRRLVDVAGCVLSGVSIVLLDEPGAGLGESESRRLAKRIREVPARFGCGVLLVEHDMEIIRNACDHLTVLDFGTVIATGHPDDVLSDESVVVAYLGHEASSMSEAP